MRPRVSLTAGIALVLLLASVIGLQAMWARSPLPVSPTGVEGGAPYVQSAGFLQRTVLSYDSLAADIYWMRVVQQYGRTKLSSNADKRYNFLYPLLDLTTSLDPHFEVAYRFGAVFLAEEFPGGGGRPDLALALLQKGLAADPTKWQYAQDIAFVHYWWRHDYTEAAEWFSRAARLPHAPNWLAPMAAVTLTQGGNRDSARKLWTQVLGSSENDWLRDQARFRLSQLDAMDQMEALEKMVTLYEQRSGALPQAWTDLVRAGLLRGIPIDPRAFPYELNPYWGTVSLAPASTLRPLPSAQVPQ